MKNIILLFVAFICGQSFGQTTGRIIDSSTGESIPYANILCDRTDALITNEEGYFTIPAAKSNDDTFIAVSYVGYAPIEITVGELKSRQLIIRLQPSMYELDEVQAKQLPTAGAIMASVRKYLQQNYAAKGSVSDKNIFLRESNFFSPKKVDLVIDKSTGFTKNNLKQVNSEINAFTSRFVSNPPREYTDMLARYYVAPGKTAAPSKLDVIKATKLKDESRSVSLEGMEKSFSALLLKHLDTTKYYRIKSGWFGSNDTISLRKDFKSAKSKKQPPRTELTSAKSRLTGLSNENSFLSKDFEFIHEPDWYEYKYEGAVLLSDGDLAYVVSFKPDRRKASYIGKLFVSASDFGVVRADYELADGKTLEGFNMKWLLGVKMSENLRKGTIIYKHNQSGEGYYLQYASREEGRYFYLHRPLKFIELSDSEKDVVAFDVKVEGSMFEKSEYLNLSEKQIADADYDNVKENEFKYIRIKQYDPSIWKDYTAIEPLQEMKRYKIEGGMSDSELAKQMP